MREVFARRAATFLVLLLLAVVLSDQSGPFRTAFAAAFEWGSSDFAAEPFPGDTVQRMLTAPVLGQEEVDRLMKGEFSGPYRLGDAATRQAPMVPSR